MDATDAVWISVLPSMKDFPGKLAEGLGKTKAPETEGGKFGKRMGLALLGGLTTIVGGATVAGKALYAIGETFDDVSDTIRVGTGATGKALDDLVDSAKNVGTKVPASFEDIGTTVADVNTRLGLTGPTLEKVSSQFLELGRITGEKIDIQSTTKALSGFGIEGENVSGALDHLYQVSQASGVSITDLSTQLGNNGAVVKQLGLSFEEAAVLVGNLDKAGLNSNQVLAAMSRSMVNLAKDGEAPADAFKRVTGEMESMLAEGRDAEALDLAGKMFGTRGAPQMIAALKSGAVSFEDLSAMAGQTGDTILGAGEDTMDFAEQWDLFKNQIMVEVAPAAEWLFGIIGDGMKWINAVAVPAIKAFIQQWKDQEGAAGKVRAVFEKVWGVLKAVFGFIWNNKEIFAVLAAGITLVVGAFKLLNAVMRMNPIGLVVTAIMLLIAGLVKLYQENETFRAIVDAVWSGIKTAIGAVVDWFTGTAIPFLQRGWDSIKSGFQSIWDAVKRVWDGIKTGVKAGIDFVTSLFLNFTGPGLIIKHWDTIKGAFQAGWDWVKNTFSMLWGGAKDIVSAPINLARDLIATALSLGSGVLSKLNNAWVWVRDTFKKSWDKISGFFTAPIESAKSTIGNLVWGIRRAFEDMKNAVPKAFEAMKSAVRKPIDWIISHVINPFLGAIGKVLKAVGLDDLAKKLGPLHTTQTAAAAQGVAALSGRASGGRIPGTWSSTNRDNVIALDRFGVPTARVEPDEMVIRRSSTKDIDRTYPGFLDMLNSRGAEALHGTLRGYAAGGRVINAPGKRHTSGYGWANWAGDFPAPMGTPVFSWKDGIVALVRHLTTSYGKHLRINHDDGTSSLYAHLSQILATVGQKVTQGQRIGLVGSTGNSTGPHLHAEFMGGTFKGGTMSGSAQASSGFDLGKMLRDAVKPFLSRKVSGGGVIGDFLNAIPGKLLDGVISKATSMFGSAQGVGSLAGGVERWRPMVLRALGVVGQPGSLADITLRRMNQESGGNPRAINKWDINAKNGTPSKGLMQVIDPTFRAYRDRSLPNDIWDPMANIVASMNYALSRYGSLPRAYNRPGGYLNGGTVDRDGLHWLSEDGRPELVVGKQLAPMRRGTQVLNARDTAGLMSPTIKVFIGDREITDIVGVEVDGKFQQIDSGHGLRTHHAGSGRR